MLKYVIESLFLDPERRDGLQIWFLADNVTNPTLPNQLTPPQSVSLGELAAIGVEYHYIAIDDQGNYRLVVLCMCVNPMLGLQAGPYKVYIANTSNQNSVPHLILM